MKKTLLVTMDFPPLTGGIANYYFNRVKKLDPDKIVVLMDKVPASYQRKVALQQRCFTQLPVTNYQLLFRFFFTRFIWPHWLPLIWHVFRIVKQEKIKILWVGQVLPVGTAVWVVSKMLNVPYFVTCHGNDLLRAKNMSRKYKLAKKILHEAEFVQANTEFTKNILVRDFGMPAERVKVVYPTCTLSRNMINEKKIKELKDKHDLHGKKILLTVARLVESKGIEQVIKALPQVWQEIPELVYLVVGDGPENNRFKQMVNRLEQIHRSKIIFTGSVPHDELPNYYALANAFILTPKKDKFGDTESFGIVYLEALEFDLPVIAGNAGGVREIKNDKITLVDSENIEQIAEEIKNALL